MACQKWSKWSKMKPRILPLWSLSGERLPTACWYEFCLLLHPSRPTNVQKMLRMNDPSIHHLWKTFLPAYLYYLSLVISCPLPVGKNFACGSILHLPKKSLYYNTAFKLSDFLLNISYLFEPLFSHECRQDSPLSWWLANKSLASWAFVVPAHCCRICNIYIVSNAG